MGILNLNQATAAIKRCCHGNNRGGESGARQDGGQEVVCFVRTEEKGWEGGGGWMTEGGSMIILEIEGVEGCAMKWKI